MDTIKQMPEKGVAERNQGNLLLDFGKPLEAMPYFEKSIEISSHIDDAYNERGLIRYGRLQDTSGALRDFSEAILYNPTAYYIWYAKGVAYEQQGNIECAISAYQSCIDNATDNNFICVACLRIAVLSEGLSPEKMLEQHYAMAIECCPTSYLPYYKRACYYFLHGNYEGASRDIEQVHLYNKHYPAGYYLHSKLALMEQKYQEAYSYALLAKECSEHSVKYSEWCTIVEAVCVKHAQYMERKVSIGEYSVALCTAGCYGYAKSMLEEFVSTNTALEKRYRALILYCSANTLLAVGAYDDALLCLQGVSKEDSSLWIEEQRVLLCEQYGYYNDAIACASFLYEEYIEASNSHMAYKYATCLGRQYCLLQEYAKSVYWYTKAFEQEELQLVEDIYACMYSAYYAKSASVFWKMFSIVEESSLFSKEIFEGSVAILYSLGAYRTCLELCARWEQYDFYTYKVSYYKALLYTEMKNGIKAMRALEDARILSPDNEDIAEVAEYINIYLNKI